MTGLNETPFILLLSIITTAAFAMLISEADAYQRYNYGCVHCHGGFASGISPKGTIFDDYHEKNKQEMHRNPYAMETECKLCHKSGGMDNPEIGASESCPDESITGIGCVGCHGRITGLRRPFPDAPAMPGLKLIHCLVQLQLIMLRLSQTTADKIKLRTFFSPGKWKEHFLKKEIYI